MIVAPASISLSGQILTPGWTTAPSPTLGLVADDRAVEDHRPRPDAALAADDRAADLRALADVGVAPDDAPVDLRARVDDGVVADDGRAAEDRAALDLDVLAEPDRAVDLRVGRDLDALALGPDAAARSRCRSGRRSPCLRGGRRSRACTPGCCRRRTSSPRRRSRRAGRRSSRSFGKTSWLKSTTLSFGM